MNNQVLTPEQIAQYNRDGYYVAKGFFGAEEIEVLSAYARADVAMQDSARLVGDTKDMKAKLALWNDAGDDFYGIVSRTARLVDATEQLLGEECYHWHHKMSMKEPFKGGAWEWHQDYGYWYNQCLYPTLLSAFIAIDPNTKENGCMQVIRGSHHMGRINHGKYGEQTGADPERVNEALKVMELVHCELDPGDTLFFHSNLLHSSAQNVSPNPRWSLICCYNTRYNHPIRPGHPPYSKLERVPNDTLRNMGREWKEKHHA
jgi:ectoine hydroxylase